MRGLDADHGDGPGTRQTGRHLDHGGEQVSQAAFYRTEELDEVISRMARQACGLIPDPGSLIVVGILRRGAPLADRLCARLRELWGTARIDRLDLDVKRYADDLTLLFPETRLRETAGASAPQVAGRCVLLVDDVLYEGHSLLRAVEWLAQRRAAAIRTAVLVDRACARLPLKADVAGLRLEVAPLQIVDVHVPPYETEFEIHVNRREATHVQES